MIRTLLFYRCLSGKRLKKALGDDLCDEIIWEEASLETSGKPNVIVKPDPQHISQAVQKFSPEIILTFGAVAKDGLLRAVPLITPPKTFEMIHGPHPAARGSDVPIRLAEISGRIGEIRSKLV